MPDDLSSTPGAAIEWCEMHVGEPLDRADVWPWWAFYPATFPRDAFDYANRLFDRGTCLPLRDELECAGEPRTV